MNSHVLHIMNICSCFYALVLYITSDKLTALVVLPEAGEGTWTLDTNHPWLLDLAKVIGTELTPEACADLYAKSWSKSHSISAEDEAED